MTGITPPQVVTPPEPRGQRYGLFTAANGPLSLPAPHGLAGGVTYTPVGCGVAHAYPNICHDLLDDREGDGQIVQGYTGVKTFDAQPDPVSRDSFTVYGSLVCGSAGTTTDTVTASVLRNLADGEQTVAETALATLLAAGATPISVLDSDSLVAVVGELEQWLYGRQPTDAGYGYIGYLHASPRIAAYAADENLIVNDGPLLKTHLGTVWVFGGGYPDDGTITVSGQVTVWRSDDVFVNPPRVNQADNQYYMIAEREYAVSYDCVAASAILDWTPTS